MIDSRSFRDANCPMRRTISNSNFYDQSNTSMKINKIMEKWIFTFWSRRVLKNQLCFLAYIVEHWLWLLLSEVWSSNDAVRRYLCSHRDGRERSWGFVCVSCVSVEGGIHKRWCRWFFFFLWTKRRETCPQEGLWPTFSLWPGLFSSSSCFYLISLTTSYP
jgi:hypothetical protein